jgi:hypothetical protein
MFDKSFLGWYKNEGGAHGGVRVLVLPFGKYSYMLADASL